MKLWHNLQNRTNMGSWSVVVDFDVVGNFLIKHDQ